VAGCCEHGDETSGSIKDGKFFRAEQPSTFQACLSSMELVS
jgi:hypothetical protein